MTDGQPTEPISIDPHPTEPIVLDSEPTTPIPLPQATETTQPIAIVPPPFVPPLSGAASPLVPGPTALSPSEQPTAVLPLSPPPAPPTAAFLGVTAGPGDGSPPTPPPATPPPAASDEPGSTPSNDRLAALQQRLDASEASARRRTRIGIAVGFFAVCAAVATTLFVDSWNDSRNASAATSAADIILTTPAPPVPSPSRDEAPSSDQREPDVQREPSGQREPNGQRTPGDTSPGNGRGQVPSTGNERLDEMLESLGAGEVWDDWQRFEEEYLTDANRWIDDLLQGRGQ